MALAHRHFPVAVIVVVHLVGRAAAVVAAADTDPGSELHWVGNTVTDRAMSYSTGGEKREKRVSWVY